MLTEWIKLILKMMKADKKFSYINYDGKIYGLRRMERALKQREEQEKRSNTTNIRKGENEVG